jgi:hypothetical protein
MRPRSPASCHLAAIYRAPERAPELYLAEWRREPRVRRHKAVFDAKGSRPSDDPILINWTLVHILETKKKPSDEAALSLRELLRGPD